MSETAASENFALKDDMINQDINETSALGRIVAKAPVKAEPLVEVVKEAPIRVKQDGDPCSV